MPVDPPVPRRQPELRLAGTEAMSHVAGCWSPTAYGVWGLCRPGQEPAHHQGSCSSWKRRRQLGEMAAPGAVIASAFNRGSSAA